MKSTDNNNVAGFGQFVEILDGLQFIGSRSCLLLQPADDLLLIAATRVFERGSVAEEFDRWITLHLVLLCQIAFNGGVNTGQFDVAFQVS